MMSRIRRGEFLPVPPHADLLAHGSCSRLVQGCLAMITPVVSAVVVVVPGDPRGGLDGAGARRLQRPRADSVDSLGGGRAELLHPQWVKGASWFPGILGGDGAWAPATSRAICVGSGVAHLHRLPLLPALDRVDDDPGPEAYITMSAII